MTQSYMIYKAIASCNESVMTALMAVFCFTVGHDANGVSHCERDGRKWGIYG